MNVAGCIIAGGKNSRMGGKNKALLKIHDVPVIERTVDLFKGIFAEIILVTNTPEDFHAYEKDCRIISDIIKDIGPLGGIHAALSQTTKEAVFFVACDMPYLRKELIVSQLDIFKGLNCDVLVPRVDNFIEPLHAIYRRTVKNEIERVIKDNLDYSIKNAVRKMNIDYFELENNILNKKTFLNINTPEEFQNIFPSE